MQVDKTNQVGSTPDAAQVHDALPALKRFFRSAPAMERCELCSAALEAAHQHLLERASRRITCSCDACAILFCGQQGAKYLRIPRRPRQLHHFSLSDLAWEEMMIPIRLAFFFRDGTGRIVAMYPSPAGAIESQLTFTSLMAMFDEHPDLRRMEPEVEALLINRIGDRPDSLIVPIDECFRLVGLIRMKWRGLSGGTEVWGAVSGFLRELEQKAAEPMQERYA